MKKIILLLITIHSSLFTVKAQNWVLCGTTTTGGDSIKYGTVFRYDIRTGKDTVLINFHDSSNGAYPYGSMQLNTDSLLYGFTEEGGNFNVGTIFTLDPKKGIDSVRYKGFSITTGRYPYQGALTYYNNLYYGMTYSGGTHDGGTIFTFNPLNNNYNIVDNFDSTGVTQYFSYGVHLTPYGNGLLYGMTRAGGTNNGGTIFSFDPVAHVTNVVANLDVATGDNPSEGTLVLNPVDSLLYGVNGFGGADAVGSFFSFDPHTNTYNMLFSFNGINGSEPLGSLMYNPTDSCLYGLTSLGGAFDHGAIYRYRPSTQSDTVLFSFNGTNGEGPTGNLTLGPDSTILYGVTQYGGVQDSGVLFSFDPKTGIERVLTSFTQHSGAYPYSTLSLANIGIKASLVSLVNNECPRGNTGSITIQPYDGYGTYTYSWAPNGGSSATANNLTAGTYTLTISDRNGIGYIGTYTITQPIVNLVIDSAINWSCATTLWAVESGSGATPPYTYSWSTGATTDTIHNVCPGLYRVNVTDGHGCPDSAQIIIITTGINNLQAEAEQVKVFPNPSNGVFTFQSSVVSGKSLVEVYNVLGQQVYYDCQITKSSNYQIDLNNQPSGVYLYRVLSETGNLLGEGRLIISK